MDFFGFLRQQSKLSFSNVYFEKRIQDTELYSNLCQLLKILILNSLIMLIQTE